MGQCGRGDARIAVARAGGNTPELDIPTDFLHDVPEALLRSGPSRQRQQSDSVLVQPCRFERWPAIPMRVVAGADDRFFPLEFQKRLARERLNGEVEVIPGDTWPLSRIRRNS